MRTLVLAFHGIGVPPTGIAAVERPYWMPCDEFTTFVRSANAVAAGLDIELFATFDDGNRSDIEIAAPLLKESRIAGAIFPCVGRLSNSNYMSPSDLRQLAGMGFEIGSHGISHVPWTTIDDAALARETAFSKKQLEDVLGTEVKSTAIPFGAYNRRVMAAIRSAGYSTIYTSDRGLAAQGNPVKMRWTFRDDELFELRQIVDTVTSLSHVMLTALKGFIKSIR